MNFKFSVFFAVIGQPPGTGVANLACATCDDREPLGNGHFGTSFAIGRGAH
jgi:hypothetical protein